MKKEKIEKTAKEKFYEAKNYFQSFRGISDEDVLRIKEEVLYFKKTYLQSRQNENSLKKVDYLHTLEYLTSFFCTTFSFDEKMLFLILTVDPEIVTYTAFCETPLISFQKIKEEQHEEIRSILTQKRIQQETTIQRYIIEQIGFFDKYLLYYEGFYLNKIICRHRINTSVLQNPFPFFLEKYLPNMNLDSVSDSRFKEIELLAKKVLASLEVSPSLAIVSNACLFQNEQLQLRTLKEQWIFFILLADPNFSLLTIYEEESCFSAIEKRAMRELGFYDEKIMGLEEYLLRRFYPEKIKEIKSFSFANKKEKK